MIDNLLESFRSTFEFSIANAFFALATWISMWTGMLSFAAVTFGAVGGFTAGRLYTDYGASFGVCLLAGTVLAGLAAYLMSFVMLRLESHWMALASIALILITRVVILNWTSVTGGSVGIPLTGTATMPWLLALLLVTGFALSRLRESRFGMAAHAVREDPAVAAALGIRVNSIRRSAIVLSGVLGGIGGVILANLLQYLSPDTFYMSLAFLMIASVVLGGSYHWAGPIIGAFVFTFLPELLRSYLPMGDEIANGILLIVIMIFLPRGLIDPRRRYVAKLARLWNRWGPSSPHTEQKINMLKQEISR